MISLAQYTERKRRLREFKGQTQDCGKLLGKEEENGFQCRALCSLPDLATSKFKSRKPRLSCGSGQHPALVSTLYLTGCITLG